MLKARCGCQLKTCSEGLVGLRLSRAVHVYQPGNVQMQCLKRFYVDQMSPTGHSGDHLVVSIVISMVGPRLARAKVAALEVSIAECTSM